MIAVEEVTAAEGLEALAAEWAELWGRCPEATPFQHPAWLLPWWRHFAGRGLCALALRDVGQVANLPFSRGRLATCPTGRLVGLAPVFVWANPQAGERQLLLLGTGVSDCGGVLFAEGNQSTCLAAAFAHWAAHGECWDVCDFQQLRAGSPLGEAPAPDGWEEQRTEQDACPVLPLPEAVEALGEVVPRRQLQKLGYYRRRAAKDGGLRVERATEETFPALFDGLLRLHRARWEAEGQPGVLSDPAVQCFHREAAAGLLRAGLLRLYGLYVGGRLAAAHYGFLAHGRAYFYLGGFDPALERLSPGLLAVGHAVEEAVGEGAREFDFLRGREAYKYHWGAGDRLNHRRRLRRSGK